jgi:hypothetical protein
MTNKELHDLTKYLFESWDRGADYDNYHMDCQYVLEALAQHKPLTEEEIEEIAARTLFPINFARAIEAKLKEKNP